MSDESLPSADARTRTGATRVYLLDVFGRWRQFKEKYALDTDADVARMLLDNFDSGRQKLRDELCGKNIIYNSSQFIALHNYDFCVIWND